MRHFSLLASVLCLITLWGCGAVDLRSDSLAAQGLSEPQRQRGRQLLERMTQAHGGLERFKRHGSAQVVLRDTWPNPLVSSLTSPWARGSQRLRQSMILGEETSQVELLDGPRAGWHLGIQRWATYRISPWDVCAFEDDPELRFWLPTLQYFMEAPWRLREATVVSWMGERQIQGRAYDLVFLSWGTDAPQALVDQYVAWVDRETGRLRWLQYTVRDFGPMIAGTMSYEVYERVQGMLWPKKMQTVGEPGDRTTNLHTMEVESVKLGGASLPARLIIDPLRVRGKYEGL
jgi:hypothetical protein